MKLSARIAVACILLLSISLPIGCATQSAPLSLNGNFPAAETPAVQGKPADPPENTTNPADLQPAVVVKSVSAPASDKNIPPAKKEIADDDQGILDTALDLTEAAQEYWEDNDMEHAIESLDQAYGIILSVPDNFNNPKLTQEKEDLRFMISKRIMEIYASRQIACKGTSNEIPMVMNDHVKREIQSFQGIERDFFIESYRRSGRYRSEMAKALKQAGMPEEISWLPLIESGFKTKALSRARAFGLWQFIPSTGYKYGLKRNDWIDERLDPQKATAAAIAYLKELHEMFGDWATVLAAYNCGEGAVARVIRDQKVNYLDNFWDFYERLPRETARYYPRFLATLAIVKDPAKYGFTLDELDKPLPYDTVLIERPVHLKSLAEKLDMPIEDLTVLNPELRRDATPNTAYALRVPPGKSDAVLASLETLPKWTPPRVEYVVHKVRRGENLSVIALKYRTSPDRIREANHLKKGKLLRVGQRLKIPTKGSSST